MSMHNSISTFVDAQSSRDPDDDLGLTNPHFPTTAFDNNHLSPYNPAQPLSNSASPSNHVGSTPGESEYSAYQPSEFSDIEDPFFGVNFDAGVGRIDSGLSNIGFHPADLNRPLPDLPAQVQPSATFTHSTYPLSPIQSNSPSSPYSKGVVNDTKGTATITQHELTSDSHSLRYQNVNSLPPTHPAPLQLTPDLSGSSHTSAEGIEPGVMSRPEDSAANMATQWKRVQQQDRPSGSVQSSGQYIAGNQFGGQLPNQTSQASAPTIMRDDEGQWQSNETTGQAGLAPDARRELSNAEVPTLNEAEERRRINGKNLDIEEWRSQAGGSDAGEQPPHSLFNHNPFQQPQTQLSHPDESSEIPPVDDAASIRENQPIEGQVYFDLENLHITETDRALMTLPRHWYDPPTVPEITTTSHQPLTSNEAMLRYKQASDAVSIASRAATWGTRRRRLSEPSLSEYDAVIDGSFLKKLSISRSREGERRQNSFFDQGLDRLDRLANIVRMRSDSKLKRVRSSHNIPEEVPSQPQGRHHSAGSLALPSRSGSFKKGTPSVGSAFAAMTGPLAAVGTTHTRKGSIGNNATSPQSPGEHHLSVRKSFLHRGRSKSEANPRDKSSQAGLVSLLRAQGGPPVANLATGASEIKSKGQDNQDLDEDEDEDNDAADEDDMKMGSEEKDPITPNYEGFKAHVLRLNPEMDPRNKWLVSRIAHQQEIRYKNLLDMRVKHSQAILVGSCAAGSLCLHQNNGATPAAAAGQASSGPLQVVTDFNSDDDAIHGEGALTDETFPQGVPMPPTRNLPAEFECQLCFKAKKFQKPSDWTKHVHEDVQPFTCTYDKCKEPKSFKRKADWVRHENERHRHLEWWVCQVDDCRHPCFRKDNFLQHLVREHKLPEPKQKTKAAIKKARLTEPAWVMLEQCHHETQNRPQDEPCKFCGKTFPTWKKLTVHLAKHMECISLPVLRLVEKKVVDANTIISPVEVVISPVTPSSVTKMEPNSSPFNMMHVAPHPAGQFVSTGYDQPSYFSTAGSNYNNLDSTMSYQPNDAMYPNAFSMQQPNFGSLGSNSMNTMNNTRSFDMMDNGFTQPKMEQPGPYRQPMATGYTNVVPNPNYNMHHQPSAYSMPQNLNGTAAVSSYQDSTILGISQAGYPFDPMAVDPGPSYHQQQTPMSRAQGSASSYAHGHSPQHFPIYPQ